MNKKLMKRVIIDIQNEGCPEAHIAPTGLAIPACFWHFARLMKLAHQLYELPKIAVFFAQAIGRAPVDLRAKACGDQHFTLGNVLNVQLNHANTVKSIEHAELFKGIGSLDASSDQIAIMRP